MTFSEGQLQTNICIFFMCKKSNITDIMDINRWFYIIYRIIGMVNKHDKGTLIKRVAPDLALQTDLHLVCS